MALLVPVQAVANQTMTIDLNGQGTRLRIYQRRYGLFMDVLLGETLVIGGVICRDRNLIVRSTYLGYSGDFTWFDTQGADDPYYTGLGERWKLLYLFPSEVSAAGQAAVV